MKKLFLIILILFCNLFLASDAKSLKEYTQMSYVGTEITKAVNGNIPFVLIIADPNDKSAIFRYFSIGKMIYKEFENKYDFCILNADSAENQEYIDFFNVRELPEVYIVDPRQNTFAHVNKKYHNSNDMRRILRNILNQKKY